MISRTFRFAVLCALAIILASLFLELRSEAKRTQAPDRLYAAEMSSTTLPIPTVVPPTAPPSDPKHRAYAPLVIDLVSTPVVGPTETPMSPLPPPTPPPVTAEP